MKLGLSIGYSRAHLDIPVKLVQRAEELGYDSVWTAEAYGSDAVTPLAFLAALTKRIKLGTGIMQLAARTPANAAMSAATVDAMAGFVDGFNVGALLGRRGFFDSFSVRFDHSTHPPTLELDRIVRAN